MNAARVTFWITCALYGVICGLAVVAVQHSDPWLYAVTVVAVVVVGSYVGTSFIAASE